MINLTRELILKAQDLKRESAEVPEWGGTLFIRGMSGAERDAFETSLFSKNGAERIFTGDNIRAKLLVRCIVDDKGERLFGDDDVAALGQRNAATLDRLYDIAQRLSGIGNAELETAVKN